MSVNNVNQGIDIQKLLQQMKTKNGNVAVSKKTPEYMTKNGSIFNAKNTLFVSRCLSYSYKGEKYKPYILKYKAHILK